jgi:hypothetical protein
MTPFLISGGESMNNPQSDYFQELIRKTKEVFDKHPSLFNHFSYNPWLEGALGNPFAGIMFIAENPSLTQVERAQGRRGSTATSDAQWNTSKGDLIFREALFEAGFKMTSPETPGGWKCYITNIIKEADYAKNTGAKTQADRNLSADIWFEVLKWEFETGKPKLIVTMGGQAEVLLRHLQVKNGLVLPRVINITHYAYIGQRPDRVRKLKAGDPIRIKEYKAEIAHVKRVFENLISA